jgi:cob(I)alamin adenosyltransferase
VTDAELYRLWQVWLAVGGAVVVVAASLLVTIWLTARAIHREARRALSAVEQIRAATKPIWRLDDTNRVADELLAAARDLETHGGQIAAALGGSSPTQRSRA